MTPFLHGKKTLDAPPLRLPPDLTASLASSRVPAVRPPADHAHNPTVETVKEGDKVVRLVITCGCGERIEVECLYPAGH